MKRCTKCGEEKALDAFQAMTRAHDGKQSRCKACRRAHDETRKGHIKEYRRALFVKNREKEIAQMQRWRAENKERKSDSDRRWRAANLLDIRERKRAYNATHKEESTVRVRKFHKLNPHKVRAWQQNNRARKASAPGRGVSPAEWEATLSGSLGLCVYCNARAKLSLDHIDPVSRGGAHDPDNIAAACLPCNMSKNDRPLLVWLAQRAA